MASLQKRGWGLIVLTLVILSLVAVVAAFWGPHDPVITLMVTGTPETKFRGTIEVDGAPREITGQVPAEFRFRGSRLAFAVKKVDGQPNDEIGINRFVNGRPCGENGNLRGGVAGGLVVLESGPLLFGKFPLVEIGLGKVDARWWDAGIDLEDRDREIILSPDAGKILWGPRGPQPPQREE